MMDRRNRRAVWCAAVLALLALLPGLPALAQPLPCERPSILVDTDDPDLRGRICAIALAALPRLEACHLTQTRPITFSLGARPLNSNGTSLGVYHSKGGRIRLLTPTAFARAHDGSEFRGAVPEAEHFDSIVVHELAHALFDQSPCAENACRVDHEYIAYALQLQSLPDATRARFIASTGLSTPVDEDRFNDFLLAFSPSSFAAAAWLHFSTPGNGCDFVGQIVRGERTLWLQPY